MKEMIAAPVAFLGTRSIAISPPRKAINTPIVIPNRIIARIFTHFAGPPKRNRASAIASSIPETKAGYFLSCFPHFSVDVQGIVATIV